MHCDTFEKMPLKELHAWGVGGRKCKDVLIRRGGHLHQMQMSQSLLDISKNLVHLRSFIFPVLWQTSKEA